MLQKQNKAIFFWDTCYICFIQDFLHKNDLRRGASMRTLLLSLAMALTGEYKKNY